MTPSTLLTTPQAFFPSSTKSTTSPSTVQVFPITEQSLSASIVIASNVSVVVVIVGIAVIFRVCCFKGKVKEDGTAFSAHPNTQAAHHDSNAKLYDLNVKMRGPSYIEPETCPNMFHGGSLALRNNENPYLYYSQPRIGPVSWFKQDLTKNTNTSPCNCGDINSSPISNNRTENPFLKQIKPGFSPRDKNRLDRNLARWNDGCDKLNVDDHVQPTGSECYLTLDNHNVTEEDRPYEGMY